MTNRSTNSGNSGFLNDDIRALRRLARGDVEALWRVAATGWQSEVSPPPQGILSGAFNPRHIGHDRLRAAGELWIGGPVYFELALMNADKPALLVETAAERCRQFHDVPLLVTRAGTFIEKARILPGTTFIVGVDTAVRVVDHRFYGAGETDGNEAAMLERLEEMREHACSFLVAARAIRGRVLRLADVPVPNRFQELFAELPEPDFRCDISSSDLRKNADG